MDLAKEIELLYDMVANDETEDGLNRLLLIAKQWDLSFKNEVYLISNRYQAKKKTLQPGQEIDDETAHNLNLTFLEFLDRIKLEEALGLKSMKDLIIDLSESRRFAIELEQNLNKAQKEIRKLKSELKKNNN